MKGVSAGVDIYNFLNEDEEDEEEEEQATGSNEPIIKTVRRDASRSRDSTPKRITNLILNISNMINILIKPSTNSPKNMTL